MGGERNGRLRVSKGDKRTLAEVGILSIRKSLGPREDSSFLTPDFVHLIEDVQKRRAHPLQLRSVTGGEFPQGGARLGP